MMSAFGHLYSPPVIRPLGWALLHFLWEGAAVAALLAGTLGLLRHRAAQARYVAACAALLAMAAAPGLTLLALRPAPAPVGPPRASAAALPAVFPAPFLAASSARVPRAAPPARRPLSFAAAEYRRAARVVEPFLPRLVATWLAGVLALSLRLLGGWVAVQRLPRRRTRPISGPLAGRSAALARRLGIRRPVKLLESAVVPVPMVLGWLRAVILVPAGAITGMPPAQLEALLAHELAHIRRHDYLVNLLQTAMETALFYHPAVWWVSHCIRVEREHCCDDLAVSALGDRITYARALTTLETLRGTGAPLALAGSGGPLLARIRRILGLPPEPTGRTSAWLGGTIVLALLLATAALLRASAADPPRPPVQRSPVAATHGSAHLKLPPQLIRAVHRVALVRAHQRSVKPHNAKPSHVEKSGALHPRRPDPLAATVARVRVVSHGATVARIEVRASHAAPARIPPRDPGPARPRLAREVLASVSRGRARLVSVSGPGGSEQAASKTAPPGVVHGIPGQEIEDVAVLDLRGVPAKEVARIRSVKDIGVLLLDPQNRGALRASLEDVGATAVAGADLKLNTEPYLEISKAALEAMPAGQKQLLVGVVAFLPDVPPALVTEKFASLQVVGVLFATAGVRGALLGKMQLTGVTVPLPDNAGQIVHSLGENKITADYLSRLPDNSVYLNIGSTQIAPDVTEELLARKIASYSNVGSTQGPAPLINLLKSRCPNNLGNFSEAPPSSH